MDGLSPSPGAAGATASTLDGAREPRLGALERRLLAAIQEGLPLEPRPFARIGARIGASEAWVRATLGRWLEAGTIKRIGVVVRHRALGYTANAMVVIDVPDALVDMVAERLCAAARVTLCYRRPRRPPRWPYNLFCMVHGRDRATVQAQVATILADAGVDHRPHALLFSPRCFKQRGARYAAAVDAGTAGG